MMEKILDLYNSFLSSYWGLVSISAIILKTIYELIIGIRKILIKDVKVMIFQYSLKTTGDSIHKLLIDAEYSKITDNDIVIKKVYFELPVAILQKVPHNPFTEIHEKKMNITNFDENKIPFKLDDFKNVRLNLSDAGLNSKLVGKRIRLVLVDKKNKKIKSNKLRIRKGKSFCQKVKFKIINVMNTMRSKSKGLIEKEIQKKQLN